jgi:glucose/arabinose dehydrogenase
MLRKPLLFLAVLPLLLSFLCSERKLERSGGSQSDSLKIEVFAQNLFVPWSTVFTRSNRCLVTERNGKLRVIENAKLLNEPLIVFSSVPEVVEAGLMGLALDPDYEGTKFIYVSYAYEKGDEIFDRVVRYKDNGNSLSDEQIIFDGIPAANIHAGCRIRFGPDKKLYVTTGDAADRDYAQDLEKLNGKILRINSDGSIPSDNPFPGSPIWTYGHRNPQGIDWQPGTETMFETEHGPSGFDGPGGGDEVNIIIKGKNYGWPIVHHRDHKEGMEDPLLEFTPAEAPASGMFYKSGVIPEFKNNFFFGCLRGQGVMRVVLDEKDPTKVVSFEKLFKDYGRIRDVAEGPDGAIYFSTSNRDGRGRLREGDDKIYRASR